MQIVKYLLRPKFSSTLVNAIVSIVSSISYCQNQIRSIAYLCFLRPLFFAKLVYEPSLPEISNKNKNKIPIFLYPPTNETAQGFFIITTGAHAPSHWKHDQ